MPSRHFTIRKMMRMTNNYLLEQFFLRLQFKLISIDWRKLPGHCENALMIAIRMLPAESRQRLDRILGDIHALACRTGVATIVEASQQLGVSDFVQSMPKAGPYHIAMWTWLNFPLVFERALPMERVDQLTYSRKRHIAALPVPNRNPSALLGLGNAISHFLRCEEGRGEHCTVDHLRRDCGTDFYAAYADDFVETVVAHDSEGKLIPRSLNRTFEIVFSYQQSDGLLDLYARVSPRLKDKLLELFGLFILGEDINLSGNAKPYNLDRLKEWYFCLATDPEDGVTAQLTTLRLQSNDWGTIGLKPWQKGNVRNIYEMAENCLNGETLRWDDISIRNASFQFRFDRCEHHRGGNVTCEVAYPDRFSLRCRLPERISLIKQYLKRWGIFNG